MTNRLILCWLTFLIMPLSCLATVNIVVCTDDGFVIAADSRLTLQDSTKTRIASEHVQKIKRVGSHVAVTYSGAAFLVDLDGRSKSVSSLIDQYKSDSDIAESTRTNPRSVLAGLDSLLTALYNKNQVDNVAHGVLELKVCGYDTTDTRLFYQLVFPQYKSAKSRLYDIYGSLDSMFGPGVSGARPGGQTDVWHRLIKGYDKSLVGQTWFREFDVEIPDSLDSTVIDTVVRRDTLNLDALRFDIRYNLMTLQDAIDFAVFIVRATIEAQRFDQSSVQGVGGVIDIAIVTPDGFRWIQRKRLHGDGTTENQ